MVMWSQVVIGSSSSFDLMRQNGTLELMVAAPVPLISILAPVMLTSAAFGLYGLVVFAIVAFPVGPVLNQAKMGALLSISGSVAAMGAAALLKVGRFAKAAARP